MARWCDFSIGLNQRQSFVRRLNSGDLNLKTMFMHKRLMALLVWLVVGGLNALFAQLPNGDFEAWHSATPHLYDTSLTQVYQVVNPQHAIPDAWEVLYASSSQVLQPPFFGICHIDAAGAFINSGAMLLHTWYHYGRTTVRNRMPLAQRPTRIKGFYKRQSEPNGDFNPGLGRVAVLNSTGDTIGRGSMQFGDTLNWTAFQMEITYTNASAADSLVVWFTNSVYSNCVLGVCDLLWLDAIEVDYSGIGTEESSLNTGLLEVWPNPVQNVLNLEFTEGGLHQIGIYDGLGRPLQIFQTNQNTHSIAVSDWTNGWYWVKIENNEGVIIWKKILKSL